MGIINRVKHMPSHMRQRRIDKKKFKSDIKKYVSLCDEDEKFPYKKEFEMPMITEYRTAAAYLDSHYFLQDIWFASKIIKANPPIHHDIGSRVDGFLAHLLSAGVKVNMIDIRPIDIHLDGLSFTQGDATHLSNIPADSVCSLSSLHVVEHFGLGRFGDEVDPKGWIRGLKEMQRIVKGGGYFYLSFPTGNKNRLCFNGQRVFEYHEAAKVLDEMELIEAAYISNYKVIEVLINEFNDFSITDDHACALYIFRKRNIISKTRMLVE